MRDWESWRKVSRLGEGGKGLRSGEGQGEGYRGRGGERGRRQRGARRNALNKEGLAPGVVGEGCRTQGAGGGCQAPTLSATRMQQNRARSAWALHRAMLGCACPRRSASRRACGVWAVKKS
jgi:hypothetical protein